MAHMQFRWKIDVKWPLNIDFFYIPGKYEWVKSPFFLKQEKGHTKVTLSFKLFFFTPIFDQNCVRAMLYAHYYSNHNYSGYKNSMWCTW
jgi:hypothetical protein